MRYEDYLADICEVESFLGNRGIGTRNTRIERYRAFLESLCSETPLAEKHIFKNSTDSRFKSPTDWLLYVLREVHELMWILRGLKVSVPTGIDEKLRLLVGGADFAALDKKSVHRDVQFELRIASYFCQAGHSVDLTSLTDIISISDHYAFFTECKRIASMAQLRRRIDEAKSQLEKRAPKKHQGRFVYGCVALDVTKIAFSHSGLVFGITPEHIKDTIQDRLRQITDIVDKAPLFSGHCEIVQFWLQIHIAAISRFPPLPMTRFSSAFLVNPALQSFNSPVIPQMLEVNHVAQKADPRESPPVPLKAKESFTFPAGAEFSFDPDLLKQFMSGAPLNVKDSDDVIARLKMDGAELEFSFMELEFVLANLSNVSDLRAMPNGHAAITLVCEMYAWRNRYESPNPQQGKS